MTDAECSEVLAEFRLLTLGPRLSEALDHAIGRLTSPGVWDVSPKLISPCDGRPYAGFEAAGARPDAYHKLPAFPT